MIRFHGVPSVISLGANMALSFKQNNLFSVYKITLR